MNCVGCYKKLKKGEFVTMNGGAMIKTKTGAVMGGKNLLGFLAINNHFDSKKNYRSLYIANEDISNWKVLQTINLPSEKEWNERYNKVYGIRYGRRPTRSNLVWPNFKGNGNIGSNGRVGELAYPSVIKKNE